MEKMIENIKKYREEYTGSRVAAFLRDTKGQKKAHYEEIEIEEDDSESNDELDFHKKL